MLTSKLSSSSDAAGEGGAAKQSAAVTGGGIEPELPMDVANDTPALARVELYRTKSCIFITTRILVVDLLNHRLQASQASPFIVYSMTKWLPPLTVFQWSLTFFA